LAAQLVPFLSGLSSPIFLTNAKDESNRIFVVEQGIIKVVQPVRQPPRLSGHNNEVLSGGEQGLLGLAFHPQYEQSVFRQLRQTDAPR
jgi:hypothetical protein